MDPGELVDFQGSLSPNSRTIYLNEWEIKERCQEACTYEQKDPDKIQT